MGEIAKDVYDHFKKKYSEELMAIAKETKTSLDNVSNLEKLVEKSMMISGNLSQLWVSVDLYDKIKLQKLVFPDKIYYTRQKTIIEPQN